MQLFRFSKIHFNYTLYLCFRNWYFGNWEFGLVRRRVSRKFWFLNFEF